MGMYPRVGAPLVPGVLVGVLGRERVSSTVSSALGLPSGIRLGQLDERVWEDLGVDGGFLLADDVVGCVRRRWSNVARLQTMVSFGGVRAADLELSVRSRNGVLRNDWSRHKTRSDGPLRDTSVCELALIPGFGALCLLDVLAAASEAPPPSAPARSSAVAVAARGLARAPWSGHVSREDPRLGHLVRALDAGAGTAREAAERALQRHCNAEAQDLLLGAINILRIEGSRLRRLRLDQELREILDAVLDSDRARDVAAARLGHGGAAPVTLEQAGHAAGVTRERVRQLEKCFRDGIAPAGKVWTPALDRALQVIRHTSPTTGHRLHNDLTERGLIGEDFSTASILAAASVLGKRVEIYAAHGLISSRPLSVSPERIHTTALRLITHWGATTLDAVCAQLEQETSLLVSAQLATLLLESQDDFCWLDQRHGWFWLRETGKNRVLNQVEKIIAVTPSISIGELREGVGRHHRMQGLRLPRDVLLGLCEDSGLYRRDRDGIRRKAGHPDWKDVLGETEAILVRILIEHGPIMRYATLKQIAVHERGLNPHSFTLHLGSSPVLKRHARGVYGLRGRQDTGR